MVKHLLESIFCSDFIVRISVNTPDHSILGWLLITSIIVFNLLLTCLKQCKSPVSYLQLKFWKAYTQQESNLFESYLESEGKALAERNLKSFFEQKHPQDITIPPNSAWEKISSIYNLSAGIKYYSILHEVVETGDLVKEKDHRITVESDDPDSVNIATLAFMHVDKCDQTRNEIQAVLK